VRPDTSRASNVDFMAWAGAEGARAETPRYPGSQKSNFDVSVHARGVRMK
jgi:hypothetical protein